MIDKYKLMQKVYGKDIVHVCGTCCNRQTKRACGLYNRPFRGLRPVRVPLVEIYGPKETTEENVPQESLFN